MNWFADLFTVWIAVAVVLAAVIFGDWLFRQVWHPIHRKLRRKGGFWLFLLGLWTIGWGIGQSLTGIGEILWNMSGGLGKLILWPIRRLTQSKSLKKGGAS